mmetsp:Transcript_11684/g.28669  ORF Transcript_11684/g.28669 Transcript_11684/m.28669 type:complete len:204 (+) Transcript_11684:1717-2328(+)
MQQRLLLVGNRQGMPMVSRWRLPRRLLQSWEATAMRSCSTPSLVSSWRCTAQGGLVLQAAMAALDQAMSTMPMAPWLPLAMGTHTYLFCSIASRRRSRCKCRWCCRRLQQRRRWPRGSGGGSASAGRGPQHLTGTITPSSHCRSTSSCLCQQWLLRAQQAVGTTSCGRVVAATGCPAMGAWSYIATSQPMAATAAAAMGTLAL